MKKNKNGKNLLKEPKVIIALSCVVLVLLVVLAIVVINTFKSAEVIPEKNTDISNINSNESFLSKDNATKSKISAAYASLESNYKVWNSKEKDLQEGIFCITTDAVSDIVFEIDSNNVAEEGKTFADYTYLWIDSGSDDFYAIVNISGKNIDLSDYYILTRDETGVYGSRALLNFYEAETVDVSDAIVIGNILAPNAVVNCENTTLYGQINSKELNGKFKKQKDLPFTGYKNISEDFETVKFENDAVRMAAIEYLINHDSENKYADYTASSQFKQKDLEAVKKITIYAGGASLKSVEKDLAYFPDLKEVEIYKADMQQFSTEKLPNIKALSITESNIKSLDISHATELLKLVLDGNSELKKLDFSANNKLQILSYSGTPLGWMDYSALPELYYLDCSNSKIQPNISISGTNLKKLKMLNISKNSNVVTIYLNTFPVLEQINCSSCAVKQLSFDGCNTLQYFKCSNGLISDYNFKGATNLKKIEIFGSNVRKIDITGLELEGLFYDTVIEIIGAKQEQDSEISSNTTAPTDAAEEGVNNNG